MQAIRQLLASLFGGKLPAASTYEPAAVGDEFQDLLDAVDAKAVDVGEAALAIRDATIAELRGQLQDLRGLGERLALAEQERIAAVTELERVRGALPGRDPSALAAENESLRRELARRDSRCAELEERLAALREKLEERHRTAAERWREIRRMQRERRELKEELARERQRTDSEG